MDSRRPPRLLGEGTYYPPSAHANAAYSGRHSDTYRRPRTADGNDTFQAPPQLKGSSSTISLFQTLRILPAEDESDRGGGGFWRRNVFRRRPPSISSETTQSTEDDASPKLHRGERSISTFGFRSRSAAPDVQRDARTTSPSLATIPDSAPLSLGLLGQVQVGQVNNRSRKPSPGAFGPVRGYLALPAPPPKQEPTITVLPQVDDHLASTPPPLAEKLPKAEHNLTQQEAYIHQLENDAQSREDKITNLQQCLTKQQESIDLLLEERDQLNSDLTECQKQMAEQERTYTDKIKSTNEVLERLRTKTARDAANQAAPPDQWPLRQPESKIIEAFASLSYEIWNNIVLNFIKDHCGTRRISTWADSQQQVLENVAGPHYYTNMAATTKKSHATEHARLLEAAIWDVLMRRVFVTSDTNGNVCWAGSRLGVKVTRLSAALHSAIITTSEPKTTANNNIATKNNTTNNNTNPLHASPINTRMFDQWKALTTSLISQIDPQISGREEKTLDIIEDLEDLLNIFLPKLPKTAFNHALTAMVRNAITLDQTFCGQAQGRYRLLWHRQGRYGFYFEGGGGGGQQGQGKDGGAVRVAESDGGGVFGRGHHGRGVVKFVVVPGLCRFGGGGWRGGGGEGIDEEVCLKGPLVYI